MLSATSSDPQAVNHDHVFSTELMPHLLSQAMRRVAMGLTKSDESAAEDLLQATSLRAWKYKHRYEPGTNPKAWLHTLMRNAFISSVTKRRELLESELNYHSPDDGGQTVGRLTLDQHHVLDADPEGVIDADRAEAAAAAAIDTALESMPPVFCEVWVLFERDHLSYVEISERMGVAVGTVMSRLHRARKAIQAEYRRQQAPGLRVAA
jgi:RNA polymerase sigma-70 factor (ECF subfamily)